VQLTAAGWSVEAFGKTMTPDDLENIEAPQPSSRMSPQAFISGLPF